MCLCVCHTNEKTNTAIFPLFHARLQSDAILIRTHTVMKLQEFGASLMLDTDTLTSVACYWKQRGYFNRVMEIMATNTRMLTQNTFTHTHAQSRRRARRYSASCWPVSVWWGAVIKIKMEFESEWIHRICVCVCLCVCVCARETVSLYTKRPDFWKCHYKYTKTNF